MLSIIRQHHERYDGNGYPDRLSGDRISIEARITSVADSFDAMISNRSYRKSLGFEKTMAEIERCKGAQFDPNVVEALQRLVNKLGTDEFMAKYCS